MKTTLAMGLEQQRVRHSTGDKSNSVSSGAVHLDHRESTAAQRQLISAMTNSRQVTAQRIISQKMHSSSRMLSQRKQLSSKFLLNKTVQLDALPFNNGMRHELAASELRAKVYRGSPVQAVHLPGMPDIVQRVVVQSDWLRSGAEGMELAKSSAGPWKKCEDKTNESYRSAAEKALGSLDGLNTLSKYGVIPEAAMKGRGPLARSHLIGASFGGQLKYAPAENIRFHPLALEYGPWQKDETIVESTARRGYITARSTSLGAGHAFMMSREIGDLVAREHGFVAGLHVAKQIEPHLQASEAVPVSVSFSYNDTETSDLDFKHSWDGLDSVLRVLPVPANNVFAAMEELKLPLPSGIVLAAGSNDIPVSTRSDMLEKIAALSLSSGARPNLIKKINNLKGLVAKGTIALAAAAEAINKHPYLSTKPGKWVLDASFSTWEDLS